MDIMTSVEIDDFGSMSDREIFAMLEFIFGSMTGVQIKEWKKTNGYNYMRDALADNPS